MSPEEKVREIRFRRMAARQGLFLHRSRRRDPNALDYGLYRLEQTVLDSEGNEERQPVVPNELRDPTPDGYITLDEVERYLTRKAREAKEAGK